MADRPMDPTPAPEPHSRTPGRGRGTVALAAAAAVLLLGGGTALLVAGTRTGSRSSAAAVDPTAWPSGVMVDPPRDEVPTLPTPPATFAGVDWRNAVLVLPPSAAAAGCPTGAVRLSDGLFLAESGVGGADAGGAGGAGPGAGGAGADGAGAGWAGAGEAGAAGPGVGGAGVGGAGAGRAALRVTLPYGPSGGVRYGDLTGDGQPEAVLAAGCDDGFYHGPGSTGSRLSPDSSSVALVVTRRGGELAVLDLVPTLGDVDQREPRDLTITDGALKVGGWPTGFDRLTPPVRTTYRWDGTGMARTGAPPVARALDRLTVPPLRNVDGSVACPGGEGTFTGDGMNPPTAMIGGTPYRADVGKAAMSRRLAEAYSIDLDGDDVLELLVSMSCRAVDGSERTSLYALRQQAERFVTVDLPYADSHGRGWLPLIDYLHPRDGVLRIRLGPPLNEVTMRWDGSRFVDRVGRYGS